MSQRWLKSLMMRLNRHVRHVNPRKGSVTRGEMPQASRKTTIFLCRILMPQGKNRMPLKPVPMRVRAVASVERQVDSPAVTANV